MPEVAFAMKGEGAVLAEGKVEAWWQGGEGGVAEGARPRGGHRSLRAASSGAGSMGRALRRIGEGWRK